MWPIGGPPSTKEGHWPDGPHLIMKHLLTLFASMLDGSILYFHAIGIPHIRERREKEISEVEVKLK